MAYAKNHTQKGRFSIQRERERGSRTRQTHFRLYNSYSMQFAQTRKQKKQKEIPSHRMTGTRGSHFDRKKEAASLQRSTFKCRNRHWRVEGFGVYSAPAYKVIIDDTVESIPPTFYNVLYHKSHFFASFFSKLGSLCMQLRFDFPRSPEFQQLRNFRVRCSFCPYFLQLNSQKCPYFQLFGNEIDQIP